MLVLTALIKTLYLHTVKLVYEIYGPTHLFTFNYLNRGENILN